MNNNFDIQKQCPQIYFYIFSVLTSVLLAIKYKKTKKAIQIVLGGLIGVILLMGVDYCKWPFQWLTWILAAFSILAATLRIIIFISPEEIKYEETD